jgi:hypothetical protein
MKPLCSLERYKEWEKEESMKPENVAFREYLKMILKK